MIRGVPQCALGYRRRCYPYGLSGIHGYQTPSLLPLWHSGLQRISSLEPRRAEEHHEPNEGADDCVEGLCQYNEVAEQ